jgi:hypothetical protein
VSLNGGFRKSDKVASLELQLEFWEMRVTSAESQIEFKETDSLKKYNNAYVDHAICVLKRGIDSGEYKSLDLKKPTRGWRIQLGKFFAESFASAYPDQEAWHVASEFASSRKNNQLRTGEIIKNTSLKSKTAVNNCSIPRSTPTCQICDCWRRLPPLNRHAILPTRYQRFWVQVPGAFCSFSSFHRQASY